MKSHPLSYQKPGRVQDFVAGKSKAVLFKPTADVALVPQLHVRFIHEQREPTVIRAFPTEAEQQLPSRLLVLFSRGFKHDDTAAGLEKSVKFNQRRVGGFGRELVKQKARADAIEALRVEPGVFREPLQEIELRMSLRRMLEHVRRSIEPDDFLHAHSMNGGRRISCTTPDVEHPGAPRKLLGQCSAADSHVSQHRPVEAADISVGNGVGVVTVGKVMKFEQQVLGQLHAQRQIFRKLDFRKPPAEELSKDSKKDPRLVWPCWRENVAGAGHGYEAGSHSNRLALAFKRTFTERTSSFLRR